MAQSPEEKLAARKEAVEGPLAAKFALVTKMLTKAGGAFLTGPKESMADFVLFTFIGFLTSGFLDGVPAKLMDPYPELKAYHARMAALPAMAKMYGSATGPWATFKQLP